jgi:hypothetical protein
MKLAPVLILLAIQVLAIGIGIAQHGQDKKPGKENVVSTLIAAALNIGLFWWAGLFEVFRR